MFQACGKSIKTDFTEEFVEKAQLTFVEYTVDKIVKTEDNDKLPDALSRKIAYSCRATVEAGIDLKKYQYQSEDNTSTRGKFILTLPEPEVFCIKLPEEDIILVYNETGIRHDFTQKEKQKIKTQGETDIRNDLKTLGILTDARMNAEIYFRTLLKNRGLKDSQIKIEFQSMEPDADNNNAK